MFSGLKAKWSKALPLTAGILSPFVTKFHNLITFAYTRDSNTRKKMADNVATSIALFGLGRAGMIHVQNIIADYRAQLAYIVEVDQKVASDFLAKYRLKETKVVHPDDAQKVYDDQRYVPAKILIETFLQNNSLRW